MTRARAYMSQKPGVSRGQEQAEITLRFAGGTGNATLRERMGMVRAAQDTPLIRAKAGIQVYSPCREPAFDKSGGLFPIIDEGHGERLAGYGVSERLRERQRRTSFERLRHGDAV